MTFSVTLIGILVINKSITNDLKNIIDLGKVFAKSSF